MVALMRLGPPDSGVRHVEDKTKAYLNEKCLGQGKFYISEARISWVGGDMTEGFSLDYSHISLHAIQNDASYFPEANLYLVIDVKLVESEPDTNPSSASSDDDSDLDSEGGITEFRFVPEDKTKLKQMFEAMNACQLLHPDPADQSSEEEQAEEISVEEDGIYSDAEENEENTSCVGNGDFEDNNEEPMDHQ